MFGEIIKPLSGLHNTLFIPIVTLFLAEYFKGIDAFQILKRAAILLLICAILMLVLSFFSYNIKDIFDADKRALLYFIKDIEDVKIFRHKNQEMQETSSVSVDKRID